VQLRECLDDEGAEFVPLSENGTIPALEHVSHIISTHIDFPQYTSALSLGIDVVRPMWVHVSVKKEKMTNARPYSPDPSQYFQDVVLTSATLPEGDKEAIMAGVLALGGQFSNPLTKLCTHIVTTDESHEKCVIARAKGINCKILLPHWFDICLKLGKKIHRLISKTQALISRLAHLTYPRRLRLRRCARASTLLLANRYFSVVISSLVYIFVPRWRLSSGREVVL
jgi:hypothetical protein